MATYNTCFRLSEFFAANPNALVGSSASGIRGHICFTQWSDTPDAGGRFNYTYTILDADDSIFEQGSTSSPTAFVRPRTVISIGTDRGWPGVPSASAAPAAPAAQSLVPGLIGAGVASVVFVGLLALISRR